MNDPVAVVSDCRGTAPIDPEAVANALDTEQTIPTNSLAAHHDGILDRIAEFDHDRVVLVAGADPARGDLLRTLEAAGIQTETVSPYLGNGLERDHATAVVAGATNAAIAGMPTRDSRETGSIDPDQHVAVVGAPDVAADLAGIATVTLIADGEECAAASLPPAVTLARGRPVDLERRDTGYALSVEHRVTDACTECGRCRRRHPDQTTDVPVEVITDAPIPTHCPVDAIRPPEDPAIDALAVDQVVWPGYGGALADDLWVHTERGGVSADVRRAARMRDRPSVSVDEDTCAGGTNGQAGCTSCEDACPNDAITITTDFDGAVRVNPDRCVACGTCVSACPTGSLEPTRTFDVETFATVLEAGVAPVIEQRTERRGVLSRGADPEPFAVALVSSPVAPAFEGALIGRGTPPVVPIEVPNVMHVPDAVAEYAVALGADGVLLASDPEKPLEPVLDTVRSANRALADVGVGERVSASETASADDFADILSAMLPEEPLGAVDTGSVARDSRHAIGRDATAALVAGHGGGTATAAAPGSGEVSVTESACTLCSTCDAICPTGALSQAPGTLTFAPDACVGCGRCESACPETAIAVSATVTIEDGNVAATGVVVEKEMVECAVCGEPFASRAGLEAMRERLDERALDALDLEVCPSCRTNGDSPRNAPRIPR
ncbi:MAG: 4Fe-4S binding protein [Halanaeroarchaeum sp.]